MRIIYVTQRLPYGEGETFIVPEVDALLAAGHELLIVPRLSGEPVIHDSVGAVLARTRPLPGAARVLASVAAALVRAPAQTVRAFWRLRHTRPIRLVYSNTIATAQGIWLAGEARRWRADHIHAHWAHLTATLAMGASALSGVPWSFTAHRYDVLRNNLLNEKLRSARFGRFIAREMLELARPKLAPDAAGRAAVIHMGVVIPPAPPESVSARTPVLLCPARLMPVKGHGDLLDAAGRLARRGIRFELWLAGDGPEREAVARRVQELGLGDRIRLLGTVPQSELLRLYLERQVHCVVLPSLHEGLSVALVEAMAYGVPVVATAVGGVPELLEGGAGVLVPPRDPAALAEALAGVLESPAGRAELVAAGRRRVESAFDVVAVARELADRFGRTTDIDKGRDGDPGHAASPPRADSGAAHQRVA